MMSHGSAPDPPATSQAKFLAHVRRNEDGSFQIHHLEEHLRAVGNLAGELASIFGCPVSKVKT